MDPSGPMYDDILIATDGSQPAQKALEHAARLSATVGAKLHVLCVVQTGFSPAGPEYPTQAYADLVEARRQTAQELVDHLVEDLLADGLKAIGYVREGKRASEKIVETARFEEVDLIVIGTHGRSGLQRFLLGSVAEGVLRGAEVPVLAIRSGGDAV